LLRVECHATPDKVEVFRSLTQVCELAFVSVRQCDALLATIVKMPKLDSLALFNCDVSRAGFQSLRQMKRLERLVLSYSDACDEALAEIAQLPRLAELEIYSTEVTDAGLLQLQQMTTLKRLVLNYTRATDTGVAVLRKALPGCEISHSAPVRILSLHQDAPSSATRLLDNAFKKRSLP
jgi:hypothetical protein